MPTGFYSTGTGTTWTDPFWNATVTTGSSVNTTIWQTWCTSTTNSSGWQPGQGFVPREISARDRLIQKTRRRVSDLRRKIAERTADELLLSQLTPEQRDEYERLQRFHVVQDGRTYRIRRGWAGNIDLVEDEQVVERWCVHPSANVPVPDNLLAQKLMIESGQADELRRIANVTPIRRAA